MPRIYLANVFHETHTFLSERTDLDAFRVCRGNEILSRRGDGSPVDGVLSSADRHGWTIVPGPGYVATPSGTVCHQVFERFWADVAASLRPALADGLDAIFLVLHGAMVTDQEQDPEGELLARIRSLDGAAELPIFGVLDLHANLTQRMASVSDGLVAYRENPHTDAYESAVRAADLLARCLAGAGLPRTFAVHAPVVWPPTGTGTADRPMRDLEQLARDIEAAEPDIWAVNVVAGYAYADVRDAGVAFSVVTGGTGSPAGILERLVETAVALRELGVPQELSIDEVLSRLPKEGPGPILLVEPADNIGGGAPGDGTGVLRALLRHRIAPSCVIINDPQAVSALHRVPVGSRARAFIGGKLNPFDQGPAEIEVEVVSRSNGRFELEDRQSHLASVMGTTIDMGPSLVVRANGVTILLTSRKTPPFDLGQLRSQGIEPRSMRAIGVKAAVAHRRVYEPIAAASYTVATPGPCPSDLRVLPYHRLRRPVFRLDLLASPVQVPSPKGASHEGRRSRHDLVWEPLDRVQYRRLAGLDPVDIRPL
jgi:microcystin degradation protein MlrC